MITRFNKDITPSLDSLYNIGFYTLEDKRAQKVSITTDLWRCELLITDFCNFKCPYCRGLDKPNKKAMSWEKIKFVIDMWSSNHLHNVRFSGGEPTLWSDATQGKNLVDIVKYSKEKNISRIAISTNGSATQSFYDELIAAGVNDFSISLDACCAETGDKMAGNKKGAWQKVVDNIKYLSSKTYVTVGVVFTEENYKEFNDIIKFETFKNIFVEEKYLDKYPILKYRINHFKEGLHVRGIKENDYNQCPLMLDDMAIVDDKHYPCIIFLRENGEAVGELDYSLSPEDMIKKVREERQLWMKNNNTFKNPICELPHHKW